jgi:hypothetical protein
MMLHKKFALEYLTLYQADGHVLETLTQKEESETLLQLCIVSYVQKSTLDDLITLKKLTGLQSLNLCSTYFPL